MNKKLGRPPTVRANKINEAPTDHQQRIVHGDVVWSLFSGAMGLDIGLESEGLTPSLAVEIDDDCCATIRHNRRGKIDVVGADIRSLSGDALRRRTNFDGEVALVVGGPPCQAFSPGGNREAMGDPRGDLVHEYFRIVREARPRFFLFENVSNLVTAAVRHRAICDRPGQHWSLKSYDGTGTLGGRAGRGNSEAPAMDAEELAGSALRLILQSIEPLGYQITFGVLNAADYGAAQHRLRFIMLGARDQAPPRLPRPTHGDPDSGLAPWATLRDVIWDLRDNPGHHYVYTPAFQRFFRLISPGGHWRDLPTDLQKEALGNAYDSGGGKTGFFRKLSWDTPAPTITGKPNRKGAALCHPEAIRPLSVRECARIQGFPDDWTIVGSSESQYRQIGNAVPTHLGAAIGRALLRGASAAADDLDPTTLFSRAIARTRAAGRNRKSRPDLSLNVRQGELPLFGESRR
jgi:DNA (cytosine-5)-methyltransferase 1